MYMYLIFRVTRTPLKHCIGLAEGIACGTYSILWYSLFAENQLDPFSRFQFLIEQRLVTDRQTLIEPHMHRVAAT